MCATEPVTGTTDWKRYEAEIEVPGGATGVLAPVMQGKGKVWFDEVYLRTGKDSQFIPPEPNPAPVPPGPGASRPA